MLLDLIGRPVESAAAFGAGHDTVEIALRADAVPLGLGGSADEIVGEGVFGGVIDFAKVGEDELPGFLGFVREDEGLGAGAVFDGVFGRGGAAFGRSGAGAAAIAFFGLRRDFAFFKHTILSRL